MDSFDLQLEPPKTATSLRSQGTTLSTISSPHFTINISTSPTKTYVLTLSQIVFDSPNLFTNSFLSSTSNALNATPTTAATSESGFLESQTHTLFLPDRKPATFEVIRDWLSGYDIFPLEVSGAGSEKKFRANLLKDAEFYGLEGLKNAIAQWTEQEEGETGRMARRAEEEVCAVGKGLMDSELRRLLRECVPGPGWGTEEKVLRVRGVRIRFEMRPLMAHFSDINRLLLFSIEFPSHHRPCLEKIVGPLLIPHERYPPSTTTTLEGRMRPIPPTPTSSPLVFPLIQLTINHLPRGSIPTVLPFNFQDLDSWLTLGHSGRLGVPGYLRAEDGSLSLEVDQCVLVWGQRDEGWAVKGIIGLEATTVEKKLGTILSE
ncbi:hypothetical protein BT69DRAFT_1335552 [Atractiella rhizophila]|nr:hypothetical protein BT69DRAFT_1335552 [Atractiella rhizophila]